MIPKLQRRIAELEKVEVDTIQASGEPRFDALLQKIDSTLVDIFGNETFEYDRFRIWELDTTTYYIMGSAGLMEIREGHKDGIERAISILRTIKDLFEEYEVERNKWHYIWIEFANKFNANKNEIAKILEPRFKKFNFLNDDNSFTFGDTRQNITG